MNYTCAVFSYYLGLNAMTLVLVASIIALVISIGCCPLKVFDVKVQHFRGTPSWQRFDGDEFNDSSYCGTGSKRWCVFSLPAPPLH
jgi:hypothetical protein